MDEEFEIPITYKGKDLSFTARLLRYGYSYKIEVDVDGTKIFFEPDEERNWRALIAYEEVNSNRDIDKDLLETIVLSIEEIVR